MLPPLNDVVIYSIFSFFYVRRLLLMSKTSNRNRIVIVIYYHNRIARVLYTLGEFFIYQEHGLCVIKYLLCYIDRGSRNHRYTLR